MAVMKNKTGTEMYLDCSCGCGDGLRIRFDTNDYDFYCLMTYTNSVFQGTQANTFWRRFRTKVKKIWSIIRGKDFYYSEIMMSKDEFREFKSYIDNI